MSFATTYLNTWQETWVQATTPVSYEHGWLRALRDLLAHGGPAILNGAVSADRGYVDLVATAILRRRGGAVVLADATWEPGSRKLDRLLRSSERASGYDAAPISRPPIVHGLMRLIDGPTVHYAVLSTNELTTFPALWGVDPDRVHFVPFCATSRDLTTKSAGGGGVFAGGNSLRDYRALVAASSRLESRLTIATALPLPPTTGIDAGPLPREAYDKRAAAADVVVVPLLADSVRSGGQQTYLNAMLRGQAVVATEAPGVRDYIETGVTGLVVPNEPDALVDAVRSLMTSPALRRRLGEAARAAVLERFTLADYYNRLLALAAHVTA